VSLEAEQRKGRFVERALRLFRGWIWYKSSIYGIVKILMRMYSIFLEQIDMSTCRIDHVVVTARYLEAGAEYVSGILGVTPQAGGRHPKMGTHNLLLRLGESVYLEVISPDPQAPRPEQPRWFGLDHLQPGADPALSAWVVRCGDIYATAAACSEPLGDIQPMSRGSIQWRITIPADGCVPLDGAAPALIAWQGDVHPASTLPDFGLSLAELRIFHPQPHRVSRLLSSISLEGPVVVALPPDNSAPHLLAAIATPQGLRYLPFPSPGQKIGPD
jgi:hypothetical protein